MFCSFPLFFPKSQKRFQEGTLLTIGATEFLNMTVSGMMLNEQHWPSSVMVGTNISLQLNVRPERKASFNRDWTVLTTHK